MAADTNGSTVFAARCEATDKMPAGTAVGITTTGHHIILLSKLAASCSM
jgi:hypothetical protein